MLKISNYKKKKEPTPSYTPSYTAPTRPVSQSLSTGMSTRDDKPNVGRTVGESLGGGSSSKKSSFVSKAKGAVKSYFSPENPIEKYMGNSPKFNEATGKYEYTGEEKMASVVPGAGVVGAGLKPALKTGLKQAPGKLGKKVPTTPGGANTLKLNAATKGRVSNYVWKVLEQFKKPPAVAAMIGGIIFTGIQGSLGGKVLSEFVGTEETAQTVSMPKWLSYTQAQETGQWDLFWQSRALEDAVLADQEMWDEIVSYIPWANALTGIEKYRRNAMAANLIWDEMAKREQAKQAAGQTDEDMWNQINIDKANQEKASVDYYNSERKKMLIWAEEAGDRDMKEDAAYWAKQAEKQRELEAKDRQAIADFWMAYKKLSQKISQESRPSNLNFGLI